MMDLLFPFALIQIEELPVGWLLVDTVPVVGASFAGPFLDRLHIGPGLFVAEHFRQFLVKLDVDACILVPAPKALVRVPEQIKMDTRQFTPIIYTPYVGVVVGNLLEDLFMHPHRFGVGADGSVEFGSQSVDLQSGLVEQTPDTV